MVDDIESEAAPRAVHKYVTSAHDRSELARLVELELDRWMQHRRELQRQHRRSSRWLRDPGGSEPTQG